MEIADSEPSMEVEPTESPEVIRLRKTQEICSMLVSQLFYIIIFANFSCFEFQEYLSTDDRPHYIIGPNVICGIDELLRKAGTGGNRNFFDFLDLLDSRNPTRHYFIKLFHDYIKFFICEGTTRTNTADEEFKASEEISNQHWPCPTGDYELELLDYFTSMRDQLKFAKLHDASSRFGYHTHHVNCRCDLSMLDYIDLNENCDSDYFLEESESEYSFAS